MNRYQPIDAFRGLAILGMVFFTVTLRLSKDLPDVIRHNVWGSVHLGDFILPMFLFASGLSLAFFLQKMEKKKKNVILKKTFLRFGKLALIGIFLSFFSAYGFLEMDEVMLSSILFITCVALSKINWKIIIVIIFIINFSYIILIHNDLTNIFIGHYLGGYPAAIYYLPVMLTGLLIGKGIISEQLWSGRNQVVFWTTFVFFLTFLIFIPLNKMTATPSFIMLSILFSFAIFAIVEQIVNNGFNFKRLEYIGKKPIRYWLIMYFIFIIPLWFYIEFFNNNISFQWYIGLLFSILLIVTFYIISITFNHFTISD